MPKHFLCRCFYSSVVALAVDSSVPVLGEEQCTAWAHDCWKPRHSGTCSHQPFPNQSSTFSTNSFGWNWPREQRSPHPGGPNNKRHHCQQLRRAQHQRPVVSLQTAQHKGSADVSPLCLCTGASFTPSSSWLSLRLITQPWDYVIFDQWLKTVGFNHSCCLSSYQEYYGLTEKQPGAFRQSCLLSWNRYQQSTTKIKGEFKVFFKAHNIFIRYVK